MRDIPANTRTPSVRPGADEKLVELVVQTMHDDSSMRLLRDVLVTAFVLTAPCVLAVQDAIDVRVQQGTATEKQTKEQLQRLLRTYDLSPWFFTNVIVIDEKAVPHSHPVLTLYTRHGRDDEHNLIPPSGSR